MGTRTRRSTGTNMYLNRLLFRKSNPDRDIEDFGHGTVIKVNSMLRPFGEVTKLGIGFLHLGLGQPIVWHGLGRKVTLTGPFALNPIKQLPFGANFSQFLLSTGQGDYEFGVPTVDLELVRLALGLR